MGTFRPQQFPTGYNNLQVAKHLTVVILAFVCNSDSFFVCLFKDFIYLFLERGKEGEREENINVWLPLKCPLMGTPPAT